MAKSLQFKFLLLLLGVVAISLSGAIIFRALMISDFAAYREGETEDKAYWILADIEGAYERNSGWREDVQVRNALWALNLGFEMKLKDDAGNVVMDTERSIQAASPLAKRRLKALSDYRMAGVGGDFVPYPLFLGGRQIGTLELRELRPAKEILFVRRSDSFLLMSILIIGGLAILLSILFSRRLTRPIKELAFAASAISQGDYSKRVAITRHDEVGNLSETFNRMAKALETHETLRRKLIADVAHELRTPLGVMRGELEAMMDGLIPDDPSRIQSLHEETGRLKNIVDGIEELNQAEASRLSLELKRFNGKSFITHIVEQYRGPFEKKGGTIAFEPDEEIELYADPDRLSQIILNLLSNALKASGPGNRVSITVGETERENRIIVEDNGSGIREEDLPFVFERFYRGPSGGLGIGLTIVKELAEAHGGRVEVKSIFGKGSTFIVYLPAEVLHNSS
ncbi:MAG: sensor histidine kinase [Syntrophus sp. (in: bacteria)]|nr:sensor histidine kinase [Syntrophus sp. (in: bacteria)]